MRGLCWFGSLSQNQLEGFNMFVTAIFARAAGAMSMRIGGRGRVNFGRVKQLNSASQQSVQNKPITVGDILDKDASGAHQPVQLPETPEQILSSNILKRCSPLMQEILQGASLKNIKVDGKMPQNKPKPEPKDVNHDIHRFRHMLAGPILSEGALDKFCESKDSSLVLDIKYDGERTLISYQQGEELDMISRNGKSQNKSYKIINERIQRQLAQTDIKSIKMDGEIVVVDEATMSPLPLSELMKLKKTRSEVEDWQLELEGKRFIVYIFDVVEFNGENLMHRPLLERRQLIPDIDIIKPVEFQLIQYPEQRAKIFDFFTEVLERKYEGLILKGENDKYYTNQTRRIWRKLKRGFVNTRDPSISKVELDLVVMGANRGSGFKNQKTFNSYLMGTPYNGRIIPISNVGSGFTIEELEEIAQLVDRQDLVTEVVPEEYDMQGIKVDVMYRPEVVFEIHAQEFTLSPIYNLGRGDYGGLSLRFPAFKGIRSDKGLREATKGQEILELSKSFNLNIPE